VKPLDKGKNCVLLKEGPRQEGNRDPDCCANRKRGQKFSRRVSAAKIIKHLITPSSGRERRYGGKSTCSSDFKAFVENTSDKNAQLLGTRP